MDDDCAEISPVVQEVFADPEQVFLALLIKLDAWTYAGMREKVRSQMQAVLQPREEIVVLSRHGFSEHQCTGFPAAGNLEGIQPIGRHRLRPADGAPDVERHPAFEKTAHREFMVTAKEVAMAGPSTPKECIDDPGGIGTAIDVVADIDLDYSFMVADSLIGIDKLMRSMQAVAPTMKIADTVDQEAVFDPWKNKRFRLRRPGSDTIRTAV
jgi:hypothetical protein